MKYPDRRQYHGLRAHIHWMRDTVKWRAWNRMAIARLGCGIYQSTNA